MSLPLIAPLYQTCSQPKIADVNAEVRPQWQASSLARRLKPGDRVGVAQHQRWGMRGLREMIPESARVILEKTRFLAGLAVLENACDETALVRVIDKERLLDEEPLLLEQARQWMGRLPFEQLDVLVIGEIGKNYSGRGIDRDVVGRPLGEG